jgi:hypothetical protein
LGQGSALAFRYSQVKLATASMRTLPVRRGPTGGIDRMQREGREVNNREWYVGDALVDGGKTGWFVGDLLAWDAKARIAEYGNRLTKRVEVKWGAHGPQDDNVDFKHGPEGEVTLGVLIEGQLVVDFRRQDGDGPSDRNETLNRPGQYAIWNSDRVSHRNHFAPNTRVLTVRWKERTERKPVAGWEQKGNQVVLCDDGTVWTREPSGATWGPWSQAADSVPGTSSASEKRAV